MSPSHLSLAKIGPESDLLLQNLLNQYIQEMAEWFAVPTRADGSYFYDTSSIWEHGHGAYLARIDDSLAGFALVGSAAEWLGDIGGQDVREFFIIRRFRKSGFGEKMATLLWNERPGEWLVRALAANTPAALFWRAAIATYTHGSYEEQERVVNGRPWLFFRFTAYLSLPNSTS